jgi:hypothetical protein
MLQCIPMKLPRFLPRWRDFTLLDLLTGVELLAGGLMAILILRWLV